MFDMEKSIAAGIKAPAPLEELGSHLREEFEQRTKQGQSATEAFHAAVQKFGPACAVQDEFEKMEAAEQGRPWKNGQFGPAVILGLLQLITLGAVLFNSEMDFGQRISGLAAMAASILLVVGVGRLGARLFPVIRARWRRTAIILVA
jgi:hypothetical protein